jgi:hypothetical protein
VIRAAQSAQALVALQPRVRVRLQAVLVQGLELGLQPLQVQVQVQDLLPQQVQVQALDLPP